SLDGGGEGANAAKGLRDLPMLPPTASHSGPCDLSTHTNDPSSNGITPSPGRPGTHHTGKGATHPRHSPAPVAAKSSTVRSLTHDPRCDSHCPARREVVRQTPP